MTKDPYRYFRVEAQELLESLSEGCLELEKAPTSELVGHLLRYAHTLKGASRVVKRPDIAHCSHELEELLVPFRETTDGLSSEIVDACSEMVRQIRTIVEHLDAPAAPPSDGSAEPKREMSVPLEIDSVRVRVQELDEILEASFECQSAALNIHRDVSKLSIHSSEIKNLLERLEMSNASGPALEELGSLVDRMRGLLQGVEEQAGRISLEVNDLRSVAAEMRLVPAQLLVDEMRQVARAAGQGANKQVELVVQGWEGQVDARVLSGLRKALIHLIQNSIAHGLEHPHERELRGKPAGGTIWLTLEQTRQEIVVSCRDDGRGLDAPAIWQRAVEKGRVPPGTESGDGEVIQRILLQGGISTSHSVTTLSGRGVGLEAVHRIVRSLNGTILIDSLDGRGTKVELRVPRALSALQALSLWAHGVKTFLPLESVREVLRVDVSAVVRDAGLLKVIVHDATIPFVFLGDALGTEVTPAESFYDVVVLEVPQGVFGVGVDGFGHAQMVVSSPLPVHADIEPIVASAVIDVDGVPRLVLDPAGLHAEALRIRSLREVESTREHLPVLVVDDSLTTRMLEQSILETAGFRVDVASSAEEALLMTKSREYGVFVVDVEMPGMNGFDFILETQKRASLREVPTILVTSLDSPADRERGRAAGARAYLVKSEFDQDVLIGTIEELLK